MNYKFFFIVGAQRCGTSFLANTLDKHPDICMAKPFYPEPKFFLHQEEVDKGKSYYVSAFYKDRKSETLLGEKSTSYIESSIACKNIHDMFPQAKIIICLRNPVDRAISNYAFTKENGIETRTMDEAFLKNQPITFNPQKFSVSPVDYLERGKYINYLMGYEEMMGRDKVHVVLFDKLIKEKEEWKKLGDFLEIKNLSFYISDKKINASTLQEKPSKEVVEKLKYFYKPFNAALEKYLGQSLSIWD